MKELVLQRNRMCLEKGPGCRYYIYSQRRCNISTAFVIKKKTKKQRAFLVLFPKQNTVVEMVWFQRCFFRKKNLETWRLALLDWKDFFSLVFRFYLWLFLSNQYLISKKVCLMTWSIMCLSRSMLFDHTMTVNVELNLISVCGLSLRRKWGLPLLWLAISQTMRLHL